MLLKVHLSVIFLIGMQLVAASMSFASLNNLEAAIIQQDYAKAKHIATTLLNHSPSKEDAPRIKFYLALSHLRLQEYNSARILFHERAFSLADTSWKERSHLGLFNIYYLHENYKEALRVISRLHEINPNSSFNRTIYLKLARANLKLTNWRKAENYLHKIIKKFPQSKEAYTAKQLLQEKQYFAVQVGAFLDRQSAEKIINDLRGRGEYGYIVETKDKNNQTFYRVRVGQMTLLDDARQLKAHLAKQGYPTEIYP